MDCTSTRLAYRQTGVFSKIATDYVDRANSLMPFVAHEPTVAGVEHAIAERKNFTTNRQVLVDELRTQYTTVEAVAAVQKNIDLLLSADTFTITTAHQTNIFTGPLYFVYKILHAIKLAEHLNRSLPAYKFVPVYYIGSEDADIEELNHIHIESSTFTWNTKQSGAVGRMKVDKEFLKLVDEIEGQLGVLPFGAETIQLIKSAYQPGDDIQFSTFKIVNALFADKGLVVLLPDNANLKRQLLQIFRDDLLHQTASGIVEKTSDRLGRIYKVQAHPRDINLFYLYNDVRERIELRDGKYKILNTNTEFTEQQMLDTLARHPERFSPNVILRGVYQEVILPNVAFIGGGGELAYWLQLKDLFEHYKVPYPVQVLRNSFLIIEPRLQDKINKLGFSIPDLFSSEQHLMNQLVSRESGRKLQLNGTLSATEELYENIKKQAASIDITLEKHVDALKTGTLHKLRELEKKMLRAEKRKFADQQRQVQFIRSKLFPANGLQERYDNVLGYYAKWGSDFIEKVFTHSLSLEQEFSVLLIND